jgi:hypothetical protein
MKSRAAMSRFAASCRRHACRLGFAVRPRSGDEKMAPIPADHTPASGRTCPPCAASGRRAADATGPHAESQIDGPSASYIGFRPFGYCQCSGHCEGATAACASVRAASGRFARAAHAGCKHSPLLILHATWHEEFKSVVIAARAGFRRGCDLTGFDFSGTDWRRCDWWRQRGRRRVASRSTKCALRSVHDGPIMMT